MKQDKEGWIDLIVHLIILLIVPLLLVSIVGVIFAFAFAGIHHDFAAVIIVGISMTAGFILFPYLLAKKIYNPRLDDLGLKQFTVTEVIIQIAAITALYLFLSTKDYSFVHLLMISLQMLIVAATEEFWARGIICYMLKKIVDNKWFVLIVSSLAFAFLTHLNEPLLDNLLYRLPGGFVIGYIFLQTNNLRYAIMFHFAYNLINY